MNSFNSLKWIFFVSKRFSSVDKKGSSGITNFLSSLGIAFGVMTLVSVLSVMNGFQGTSINSLLEISSSHIRVSEVLPEDEESFIEFLESKKEIKSALKMYESQSLISSPQGKQSVSIIKAVPSDILDVDAGFNKEISIYSGDFDISGGNKIVLGLNLAESLGVYVGSKVNLLALSSSKDVALISKDRIFTVTGIFESRNLDINQSFAFVSLEDAKKYFGKDAKPFYALKLKNYNTDAKIISDIKKQFPNLKCLSWKSFNKSFFSTLRIEKDMIFLLIMVIFLVVGINIYNGTRRLVFERAKEISIMSSLGAKKNEIKMVFIVKGFLNGVKGVFIGIILALLITKNIGKIFIFLADAEYYFNYVIFMIFSPSMAQFLSKNYAFEIYASIPAVVKPSEVFLVGLFGILTPLISSWWASRNVLKMNICEVLHEI